MVNEFTWGSARVAITVRWDDDRPASISSMTFDRTVVRFAHNLPLVEMLIAGTGHWIANARLVHTSIGRDLRYVRHETDRDETLGIDRLTVTLADRVQGVEATVTYELADGAAMLRTFVTVTNRGAAPIAVESVTSWACKLGAPPAMAPSVGDWALTEADYDWLGEGRWRQTALRELCPVLSQELTGHDPRGEHAVVSTGTWSTGSHAPLAVMRSRTLGLAWLFQIEHNGAWRWEVGDDTDDGYMALSGPTHVDHAWSETLKPGESFTTVPASITLAADFDGVIRNLTAYRRAMRTTHEDNAVPRIVFNDYMNTINGDPTTGKLLPLVEGAAEAGCEIFVIDCGWYDDGGDWWPSVGEWLPSATRFPGPSGIREVIDAIRDAGMVPGLWLEPEVIGVASPVADRLPDSAFFQRSGRRIIEQERYILDLRDPAARAHLDGVIDRLVDDYGIGYFKMDYNVSPGAGTDHNADSVGAGMLGHNRAYDEWIEGIHRRHPQVILENCSSGGMREDFAQTSRFQVQSTSDQQDYRLYPAIAASAPMMMLPEQAANWAYPQADMTPEQSAFNLNTTMLGRFFLSGYLNRMDAGQRALIGEAVRVYRDEVQPYVGAAVPFWPMGLPSWTDRTLSLGLDLPDRALVTLWSRDAPAGTVVQLAVPQYRGRRVTVTPIFPVGEDFADWPIDWDETSATIRVTVPSAGFVSRTFRITPEGGRRRA